MSSSTSRKYTNDDEFEFDEYWCPSCKEIVQGNCELHGDLEPCPEIITAPGTKDPKKFPVPSFVKIDTSKIPNAGFGVFATEFIRPGVIIGEYKGKKLSQKKYKELEQSGKESGYAWKVQTSEGVHFVDGSSYRSSNWLRFINCARYQEEENVMMRVRKGDSHSKIQILRTVLQCDLLIWTVSL
eukprot:sb/3471497/